MRIYRDIFSNDQMFNEHYRIKLVSEVLFEVTGKLKPHTNGNSSEARDEEPEDENKVTTTEVSSSRCGVDVILDNHLVETFFEDKEQLCTYLTAFMEKLLTKLTDEQVENFQTVIQNLLTRYDQLQFFTGESMDRDGTIAMLEYREIEGFRTPIVMMFKHGLVKEQN